MQRPPALATLPGLVGGLGALPRPGPIQGDDRIQLRIEPVDALEQTSTKSFGGRVAGLQLS